MNPKRLLSLLAMLILIGGSLSASGHGYRLDNIKIVYPWAMSIAPSLTHDTSGAGYLVLRNTGDKPDKLLSASTAIASKVELRFSDKTSDPSIARQTNAIEIPAGGEVRLQPGGSHLMLMGLKQPLKEGGHFSVVLHFEHAGTIAVDMFVQSNASDSTC